MQSEIQLNYPQDGDYDVPYTTVHTGRINGGVALNIVPNLCEVDFEIRNLAEDDPKQILKQIKILADQIVVVAQTQAKEAAITFETTFSYPGLNTSGTADVVRFVTSLTGSNKTKKVAFGTEGGLFSNRLDIPTVVCGPGSMMQGHKPDEYIEVSQIDRCDAMLDRLIDRLCDGL
jgi:acetylornithine deacetylase